MLSKILDKDPFPFEQDLLDDYITSLDLSKIIIPFSEFFSIKRKCDVYSGNENIPFKDREAEYKSIILKEFLK